jgi:EmrB/QacA subfamily drug resistance transporter
MKFTVTMMTATTQVTSPEPMPLATAERGRGRWWALAALVLSGLVLALDMTILITALPTLSARLGASTTELQWIANGYTLALGGLMLPAGVLADRYGRRRLLLGGLLLFGVASVVASMMTTASGLIAMRVLMGAAGAVIMPLTLSILPTIFSEEERPRAVAAAAAGAFLGLPFGPLVAGWLLTHFAWGSVFLINAPVVALALAGVALFVPESRDPAAPRIDWMGAVLAVVGICALVEGIIAEPDHGWTDPVVLLALLGGAALLAGFVVRELTTASPLVDLRLFRDGRFAWSTAAFMLVGFAMTGVLFVVSPFLQIVLGNDAEGTGLRLLPLIGGVMVGAISSERLTAWVGTRYAVAAGLATTALGMGLLSRVSPGDGFGLIVGGGLAVIGLGLGMAMPPAQDAILGALPAAQVGAGNALTRTLQQVSASFGVAILGSVLNGVYRSGLTPHLAGLPAAARDGALGSIAGAAAAGRGAPGVLTAARDAYAQGMSEVLLVCIPLALLVAALVARFLPDRAEAQR